MLKKKKILKNIKLILPVLFFLFIAGWSNLAFAQQNSNSVSNILNILKLEAHGYSNECNNIYIKDVINSMSREITLGHYMNAAVSAKLEAHYQSYCYLKNQDVTPLSVAAGNIGEYLATYVLFWHKIAEPSASIFVSAKYAEELLKYSNTQPKLISDYNEPINLNRTFKFLIP